MAWAEDKTIATGLRGDYVLVVQIWWYADDGQKKEKDDNIASVVYFHLI